MTQFPVLCLPSQVLREDNQNVCLLQLSPGDHLPVEQLDIAYLTGRIDPHTLHGWYSYAT
jgi:hypothetical protein